MIENVVRELVIIICLGFALIGLALVVLSSHLKRIADALESANRREP